MRIIGWRLEGSFPNEAKVIVAVAPHTSNIDFLLTVVVIWSLGIKASFLAKQSLFQFPLEIIMSAFGGIPVDRGSPQGLFEQMTEQFDSQSELILGITPEGTRSDVVHWKRGFALIACAAKVPVLTAVLNYKTKLVRFDRLISTLDDAEQIVRAVQEAAVTGASRKR